MAESYYVKVRGRITGPHSLDQIRNLVLRGKIGRFHTVSTNQVTWMAAKELESLFPQQSSVSPAFPAEDPAPASVPVDELCAPPPQPVPRAASPPRPEVTEAQPRRQPLVDVGGALARAHRLSVSGGLSATVILLFCLSIPHTRAGDRLTWWWDLTGEPGSGGLVFASFCLLLLGFALPVLTFLWRGRSRGWAYLAVAACGLLGLCSAGIFTVSGGGALFLLPLVPATCAGVLCASIFRSQNTDSEVAGSALVLAGRLVMVTVIVATLASIYGCTQMGEGEPSPFAVFLAAVGLLSGFGCGLLGGFGETAGFSRERYVGTVCAALGALALPGLAGLALGYGASVLRPAAGAAARFEFLQLLRLAVTTYAFIGLGAIGLWELLIDSARGLSTSHPDTWGAQTG